MEMIINILPAIEISHFFNSWNEYDNSCLSFILYRLARLNFAT